ncbi:MAG TPA: transposase [Methanotrichaceae archaeon]|nr:transposase [Methanotrichaceae archaeon]
MRDTRKRSGALKGRLQQCGTKSAKRHLKKLSGKMARFARDVNHRISRGLITKAKDTLCLISLEDLEGIRRRVAVRKPQRHDHASWSFDQLRQFVTYKAAVAGVPLVFVNPAYTSQECPICHCISRSNRPTRDEFRCTCCGFSGPADNIAAANIAARVAVNLPIVARFFAEPQALPFRVG